MAYELKKRPYSDEEAKKLLAPVMSPETTDWHYNKHHLGYVVKLNEIEEKLKTADRSKANANYSEFTELKRQESFNHAGMVLHDIFWDNLGGNGDVSQAPALKAAIEKEFGAFQAWKEDFIATTMGAKNSGWGLLVVDTMCGNKLRNVQVDFHHFGAIWGAKVLIACDVFEHAYYHKDGPNRGNFIKNFVENLHWGRIEKLFK
jgi:Fe-Mn family superoxide dismutase